MRRLAAILVVLAALMAGQLGPAPAASAEVLPDEWWVPWPTASCATGAMTAESTPGRAVWVSGWIEPCQGTAAPTGARFAVVYFGPGGGTPGRPLHYADQSGRTPFEGKLQTKPTAPLPLAVCLAFSPTGLLSCVSIDVADDDPDLLVVTPIPTDHPRVAVPVWGLIRLDGDNHGYCGTCL